MTAGKKCARDNQADSVYMSKTSKELELHVQETLSSLHWNSSSSEAHRKNSRHFEWLAKYEIMVSSSWRNTETPSVGAGMSTELVNDPRGQTIYAPEPNHEASEEMVCKCRALNDVGFPIATVCFV